MADLPPPLYTQNPLGRFSDRANDYARYRPGYPSEAIATILTGLDRSGELVAADVGAGTGIFSHLLAEQGVTVWAIEPNAAMGEVALPHPKIYRQNAPAEATGLPDHAVQLVTCAQAFHWFDPMAALTEFHRILTPGGRITLVWNDRDLADPFTQEYSKIIRRASDKQVFDRNDRKSPAALAHSSLFVGFRGDRFLYRHSLDRDGLVGLALSSSYIPKSGSAHDQLILELQALHTYAADPAGQVAIQYTTQVYQAEANPN